MLGEVLNGQLGRDDLELIVDTELYRDIAHNPRIPLNDYWSDVFLAMESAMICPCPLATYRGTIQ
ncbi:MAG: hypothetical protein AAGG69_11745, partial [Pseudomonadota bacterium]